MLAVISLPFKGDIAIGIPFHKESHDPFGKVAEIESHIQQFFHLLGMYRFVVYGCFRQRAILFAGEYHPEEVDGGKSREWDDVVVNNLHSGNY